MTCKYCGAEAPPDPETGYDADDVCPNCDENGVEESIEAEEERVERYLKVEEIFAEGFKRGQARAGLSSNHLREYHTWLLDRAEGRT